MFSAQGPMPATPQTPAGPSRGPVRSRPLVTSALRGAGLLESDQRMRDAPGASSMKKNHAIGKIKSHKPKAIDGFKAQSTLGSRHNPLASRIAPAGRGDVANRGAAAGGRPLLQKLRKARPAVVHDSDVAPGKSRVIEQWREFVKQRYNPEAQFLNLENMADDPFLKSNKLLAPGMPGTTDREGSVVFKLASQLQPPIVTLSLANNKFDSARCIIGLSHYLPKLANLSLENNNLRLWHDLDFVSPRKEKLEHLRELILNGNPLREHLVKENQGDVYRSEMLRRFPLLEMLDHAVVTKIGFDVPLAKTSTPSTPSMAPTSFPVPMCPNGIPAEIGSVVGKFLSDFFTQFDTSRNTLHTAYTPESTFSFSANTPSPPRARIQGLHPHTPGTNPWESWIELGSRNLNVVGAKLTKSMESLYVGSQNIMAVFAKMPATKHPIAESEKFVIDAWTSPNVLPTEVNGGVILFITIHGQFTEDVTKRLRSFDRSFILAPSTPGSLANQAGWPAVILSDQLVVRGYSKHDAWMPGPLQTQAESATTTAIGRNPVPVAQAQPQAPQQQQQGQQQPTALNPALLAIPEPQRTLVMELSHRTGLNASFSIQCLEGNAWDMGRAVANFEELKGSIPSEAFI